MIWLSRGFSEDLGGPWSKVEQAFAVTGKVYREPEGAKRKTLRFEAGGKGYFLKLHWGVGWLEILKNLVTLRLPVLGASNEWRAIIRLEELGVETMELAAYGEEGLNPASLKSFVVTRELEHCVSLEDYCSEWKCNPPDPVFKRSLIERLARISRTLHDNGVNHRDYYICHFLLRTPWQGEPEKLHLYLIDLHRVQIRKRTPYRWRVKDIGSLYFSAMDIGLTSRDLLRFIRHYRQQPLRQVLQSESEFWQDVAQRANALSSE